MVARVERHLDLLLTRGKIAAAASRYLRSEAGQAACAEAMLPGVEEIALVPAAPEEPAVLTFHRMEATGSRTIVLASELEGRGVLVVGQAERGPFSSATRRQFDLYGGMTTGEWMRLISDEGEGLSFTAEGKEFAAELNSLTSFATV